MSMNLRCSLAGLSAGCMAVKLRTSSCSALRYFAESMYVRRTSKPAYITHYVSVSEISLVLLSVSAFSILTYRDVEWGRRAASSIFYSILTLNFDLLVQTNRWRDTAMTIQALA